MMSSRTFAYALRAAFRLLISTGLPATSHAQKPVFPSQTVEVALYPALEPFRMGGIPPGMLKASFLAGHGLMKVTALGEQRTKLEFEFAGLIPNGVYTMWNVLSPLPDFSDEPLGPTGYGKHGVIADHNGRPHAVVYLDKRPGVLFLLDYHSDGKLEGEKGDVVFPGALWAPFPPLDEVGP